MNSRVFGVLVAFLVAFAVANSEKVDPKFEELCRDVSLGVFPNPFLCSSYILCVFGTPEVNFCPILFPVFDEERSRCVEGEKIVKIAMNFVQTFLLQETPTHVKSFLQRKYSSRR